MKVPRPGDRIACYYPSTMPGGGDRVRACTALGRIVSGQACEADRDAGFHPWRVDAAYAAESRAAPIAPLLDALDLTRCTGRHRGMALRSSRIRAADADLVTIAAAKGVAPP